MWYALVGQIGAADEGRGGMRSWRWVVTAGLTCVLGVGLVGVAVSAQPNGNLAAVGWEPLIVFPEAQGRPLVRSLNAPRKVDVHYGRGVDPDGFRATLNGEDVSGLFAPRPSRSEVVSLPLQRGENELRIEATRRIEPGDDNATAFIPSQETHILRIVFEAQPTQVGVHTEVRSVTDAELRSIIERHRRGQLPSRQSTSATPER